MNTVIRLAEKRETLVEVSKVARALRDIEEVDGTINYMLLNYIYNTGDAVEFKTYSEWESEGYVIRKGERAFIAWAKPESRMNADGKNYKYFPVKYLFSDKQVYKIKENSLARETKRKIGNFVGEIKISYSREKEIEYRNIKQPETLANFLFEIWDDDIEHRESFYVVAMNNQSDIIGYAKLFTGGINQTIVDERVLFQLLLNANAVYFVIAHNHPSGNITPSLADVELTRQLRKGADILKINMIDHVILAGDRKGFYSFVMNGLL